MMTTLTAKQFGALREFAIAVGMKLRKHAQDRTLLVLCYGDGEPCCCETSVEGVLEALTAYAGGHVGFADAEENYKLAVR